MIEGIGRLIQYFKTHGGSIYRLLGFCFIVLSLWGGSQSLNLKRNFGECRLSDWSKVSIELDYATNILPYKRYTGRLIKYLRREEYSGFVARLDSGDTLKIGMDNYALTNMSRMYLLDGKREFTFFQHFPFVYNSIWDGGVEVFNVYKTPEGWAWTTSGGWNKR